MKIIILSLLLFSSSLFSCQRTPPQDPEEQKQWAAAVVKYQARYLNIPLHTLPVQTRQLVAHAATQELRLYSDQHYPHDHPRLQAIKHTLLDTVSFLLRMDADTNKGYNALMHCDNLTYDPETKEQATAFITYLLEEKKCSTDFLISAFAERMDRAVSNNNQDYKLLNLYLDRGILSRWNSYSPRDKKDLQQIVNRAITYPVKKDPAVTQIIETLNARLAHEKTTT